MRTILNFEGRLFVASINLSGFESGIALAMMIHALAKKGKPKPHAETSRPVPE
jgi:hypothetical protein